jgi:hypothetical protein
LVERTRRHSRRTNAPSNVSDRSASASPGTARNAALKASGSDVSTSDKSTSHPGGVSHSAINASAHSTTRAGESSRKCTASAAKSARTRRLGRSIRISGIRPGGSTIEPRRERDSIDDGCPAERITRAARPLPCLSPSAFPAENGRLFASAAVESVAEVVAL